VFSTTARAKFFLRRAIFFAKTCCTISAISYSYEQVTSVYTHFKPLRVDEDIDSLAKRLASYRGCRGCGSWFLGGDVGCEFQLVCQPVNHQNFFMEE
jgi:hypothetical protein